MPANKNALLRYKILDKCLRNRYRRWTLDDLVEAVSEALYDMEGIKGGVSVRTINADLKMMRSDKLGYNAPIEVYDKKYYRYSDSTYSITETRLTESDYKLLTTAVTLLDAKGGDSNDAVREVLVEVRNRLSMILRAS